MRESGDTIIRSSQNSLIKLTRSLQRRKARYQERAFVVEGFRAVEDALNAGAPVRFVLIRAGVPASSLCSLLKDHQAYQVEERLFDDISSVDAPQGILAVVSLSEPRAVDEDATLVLVADGIKDPGNLGTLIRSAAGAGVDHVVLTEGSVDPWNPKVVRSAMGAHFHVPVSQERDLDLESTLATIHQVVVADANGETDYDEIDFRKPTVIVVGGEAFGPTRTFQHARLLTVRIPLHRNIESLNAGVAGSLMLFEAARQRK